MFCGLNFSFIKQDFLLVLVSIPQRKRTNKIYRYVYREIYYERLAHAFIETEKSHDLLSANWRPRKAGCVIPTKHKDLRTRRANDVSLSLCLKAQYPGVMVSEGSRR